MNKAKPKQKRNAAKGKRYSVAEKRAVLDYVESVNLEKGRGGISAASRRFGVSPLTITNWLQADGAGTGRKLRRPSADVFSRLAEIHERIVSAESELSKLRKQYSKLKSTI